MISFLMDNLLLEEVMTKHPEVETEHSLHSLLVLKYPPFLPSKWLEGSHLQVRESAGVTKF